MTITIILDDIKVTRVVDNIDEKTMYVYYYLLDKNGGTFGEEQIAIFWANMPMDVDLETGEKTKPANSGNWFQLPEKYQEDMKERAADAREALLVLLE